MKLFYKALLGEVEGIADKDLALVICGTEPEHYLRIAPSLKKDLDIAYAVIYRINLSVRILEHILTHIQLDRIDIDISFIQQLFHHIADCLGYKKKFKQDPIYKIIGIYDDAEQYILAKISPVLRGTILWYREYFEENDMFADECGEFGSMLIRILDENESIEFEIKSIQQIASKDVYFVIE